MLGLSSIKQNSIFFVDQFLRSACLLQSTGQNYRLSHQHVDSFVESRYAINRYFRYEVMCFTNQSHCLSEGSISTVYYRQFS